MLDEPASGGPWVKGTRAGGQPRQRQNAAASVLGILGISCLTNKLVREVTS